MTRFFVAVLFTLSSFAFAQNEQELLQDQDIQESEVEELLNVSEMVAHKVAELTGTAINPLLVTGAIGAYKYYTTPETKRSQLPWHYSPWFWGICLALVSISALIGILSLFNIPFIPGLVEQCNKWIGLLTTTPIILVSVSALASELAGAAYAALTVNQPYAAASFVPWEFFSLPEILWFIAIVPMALFVFFAIWLLNYTFDVLVSLSPFGWLDLCLRILRGIFFIVLLAVAIYCPQLVFVLVIPIVLISIFMFGWSMRRVVMGFAFIKDFLNRKKEVHINEKGVIAFAGPHLGIPKKIYGRLTEENGNLIFSWRRFFIFRRKEVIINPRLVLIKGFFYSKLYNGSILLFSLPPRYQKIEAQLQSFLDIELIDDGKLKKGLKGIVEWIRNLFRRR
ncbi:MAG: hypothetical protein LBU89_14370 [Fibromonadaceae bacterium]|jgi:hypothetical protein|nr:hypothetical protein [Fibromonadaceae bacterium]